MRIFICIIISVVLAAVVAGFFIVDSPAETRLRKFDEQRVGDLSFIQSEIINYWTRKGVLPLALENLKDNIRGLSIPVDPESGTKYVYEAKGKFDFYLCANFSTNNVDVSQPLNKPLAPRLEFSYPYNNQDWWGHSAGYVCFSRAIDPELYPILKK